MLAKLSFQQIQVMTLSLSLFLSHSLSFPICRASRHSLSKFKSLAPSVFRCLFCLTACHPRHPSFSPLDRPTVLLALSAPLIPRWWCACQRTPPARKEEGCCSLQAPVSRVSLCSEPTPVASHCPTPDASLDKKDKNPPPSLAAFCSASKAFVGYESFPWLSLIAEPSRRPQTLLSSCSFAIRRIYLLHSHISPPPPCPRFHLRLSQPSPPKHDGCSTSPLPRCDGSKVIPLPMDLSPCRHAGSQSP